MPVACWVAEIIQQWICAFVDTLWPCIKVKDIETRVSIIMWPALTKGSQSRWEDHEITRENITKRSFSQFLLFLFCHGVGRLLYHVLIAHSPFWPINNFKTHFKGKKSLLWMKQRKSFQLDIISKWPLYYHLNSYFERGHNFTLASTVWNLMSN